MMEQGYEGTPRSVTVGRQANASASVNWGYLIIWEFQIRPGMETRFEQVYGPRGLWSEFFAAGKGYVGTELVRNTKTSSSYLTLDFWTSRSAYLSFREENRQRYSEIDAECEAMTSREVEVGSFERATG